MPDSRKVCSVVRVVLLAAVAVAAGACAAEGEGSGGSPFATSEAPPASVSVAAVDAAVLDASPTSAPSSTNSMDACADGADVSVETMGTGVTLEASSDDAWAAATSDAPDDALDQDAAQDAESDADDADAGDSAPFTVAVLPPLPAPGDLVITEVMFQPSGPEPESEWFEIYNQASGPRLLSGVTIEDGYLDTEVIASNPIVVAPPGEYLLLVRTMAGAQTALLPAASIVYAYGVGVPDDAGIELDAGPFGEITLWSGQTAVADVPYGQWGVSAPGQSLELSTSATSQSDPSQWCIAENPWAPGSDDGTPGAASDCP